MVPTLVHDDWVRVVRGMVACTHELFIFLAYKSQSDRIFKLKVYVVTFVRLIIQY